jgi:hypothetical protein
MKKESRNVNATYTDLSTVLRLNGPSQAEKKRQSDALGSDDPVIEHLMRSKALKAVFLGLIAAVLGWGIAIIVLVEMGGPSIGRTSWRLQVLLVSVLGCQPRRCLR